MKEEKEISKWRRRRKELNKDEAEIVWYQEIESRCRSNKLINFRHNEPAFLLFFPILWSSELPESIRISVPSLKLKDIDSAELCLQKS